MVRILGITIGEEKKDQDSKPRACKHPIFKREMRLNPEKQRMEMYCKQCGQLIEDGQ